MLELLAELDTKDLINKAKTEGLEIGKEIGLEIGIRKANIATAKRLRAIGMTDMQLHEFTGLSFEDIKNL